MLFSKLRGLQLVAARLRFISFCYDNIENINPLNDQTTRL